MLLRIYGNIFGSSKFESLPCERLSFEKIVFFCFISFSCLGAAYGQLNYNVPQNMKSAGLAPGAPAGSYALSGFESVNPFSGKVNFSLPLLKIGGRGNAGYGVNLTIQRNWSITHNIDDPNRYIEPSELYNIKHTYTPTDEDTDLSYGYTSNLSAGFMKGRSVGSNSVYYQCGNQACYDRVLTRLSFVQPDGSEIEFRDVLRGGKITQPYDSNLSRGTHWVSVDGSNATFISNAVIYDYRDKASFQSVFYPSGTLYLANGTKYTIVSGRVQQIIDINGNRVTPGKDSLGREVTVTTNNNPEPNVHRNNILNFKGTGGTARTIKINYSFLENRLSAGYVLTDLWALFQPVPVPVTGSWIYNPEVVSSVVLPDGRAYEFRYNNYGELTEINLPTGGRIEYVWQSTPGVYGNFEPPESIPASHPPADSPNPEIHRRVEKRRVYVGGVLETETVYGAPVTDAEYNTWVTVGNYAKANGNLILTSQSKHRYSGMPRSPYAGQVYPPLDPGLGDGKEIETEIYDRSNVLLRKTKTEYEAGAALAANPSAAINLRVSQVTETLADAGKVKRTKYGYDNFNNQTDAWEYDYGDGQPGQLLRRSHTNYLTVNPANGIDYTALNVNLKSLPEKSYISTDYDGNNIVAQTEYKYDESPLVPRSNVVGWSERTDPQSAARGNLTKTRSWLKSAAEAESWIETKAEYDVLGNAVKTIDAKGNQSTINYNDAFGSPDNEVRSNTVPSLNGQPVIPTGYQTFAFPTSLTNPLGWIAYTQFDYHTGQPVDAEDVNGVVNTSYYNDPLDRITQSIASNNIAATKRQTTVVYDDAPTSRKVTTTSDLNSYGDNLLKSESFYDGLGRTTETRRYEVGGGYVATKSVPFVMVQDTDTNIWHAASQVSNPYRPLSNEQPIWTTSLNDALGRTIKVITPDEATVKTEYTGNAATVTDQAGKQRRSITDALGRLVRVDEPTDSGLGIISSPNQPTSYTYDVLGNLRKVEQGGQRRYFLYDSLSRLVRVRNPELGTNSNLNKASDALSDNNADWSIGYSYDASGNLVSKTDPKGVVTNYLNYDALNRAQSRTYSGESSYQTPAVTYTYDVVPSNSSAQYAKGKLTRVSSAVSTTEYTNFDALGRIKASQQTTPVSGTNYSYNFSYTYDLAGNLKTQTYPSGRVVTQSYNNDGSLNSVTGSLASVAKTYASGFAYTAHGAVKELQLGNSRWETISYNSRLQPTQIGLGTSRTDTSLWRVNYDYGIYNSATNAFDQTKNNGNVARQSIIVQQSNVSFVQDYTYDSLNRLKTAQETGNGTQTWKQAFLYDRFGNRTFDTANTTTIAGCPTNICNPQINAVNNRFSDYQGYAYDNAGNLTGNNGKQYFYDAENKQYKYSDGSNSGTYEYDGDGRRVKKNATWTENSTTKSDNTIFVYDAFGRLAQEYSVGATTTQAAATKYLTQDSLGSPRIITKQDGTVDSRRDFLPFGEDIAAGVGGRSSVQGYGGDNIRQKFTSYERDNESDLDFAQARMYNFRHGRFIAVDPLMVSADPANPQTWNRYIYVLNNPLIMIDPTGEIGDYYDKDGNWLFTDNINDDKVYLATVTTTANGVTNIEAQDLGITHTQFKAISNIVRQEGATNDTNEYLWIAHASNNRAQATNKSLYGLLMSGFSSVGNKTGLSTKDGSLRANAARAGVINVLSGGADPTGGAQYWDGTDFIAWGLNAPDGEPHNKFKEHESIVIREDVFNAYLSSQGSYYPYRGRRYVIPADVFNRNKNPNNWGGWNRNGIPESGFVYGRRTGRGILYATGTAGKSIFWNPTYKWLD